MHGIEEREWNKPLGRLREDGKWELDSDKQERDALKKLMQYIIQLR